MRANRNIDDTSSKSLELLLSTHFLGSSTYSAETFLDKEHRRPNWRLKKLIRENIYFKQKIQ